MRHALGGRPAGCGHAAQEPHGRSGGIPAVVTVQGSCPLTAVAVVQERTLRTSRPNMSSPMSMIGADLRPAQDQHCSLPTDRTGTGPASNQASRSASHVGHPAGCDTEWRPTVTSGSDLTRPVEASGDIRRPIRTPTPWAANHAGTERSPVHSGARHRHSHPHPAATRPRSCRGEGGDVAGATG